MDLFVAEQGNYQKKRLNPLNPTNNVQAPKNV